MRNNHALLRSFMAAALCVLALAATAQQRAGAANVGELKTLQAELAVLKAKIAKANAQAELAKAGRPERGESAGYALPPEMTGRPPRVGAPGGAAAGVPAVSPDSIKVHGVHGIGAKLVASMVFHGGAPRDMAVGDVVRGVRVVSIDMDRVVIESGGQQSSLAVEVPAAASSSAGPVAPSPFGSPLPGMLPR